MRPLALRIFSSNRVVELRGIASVQWDEAKRSPSLASRAKRYLADIQAWAQLDLEKAPVALVSLSENQPKTIYYAEHGVARFFYFQDGRTLVVIWMARFLDQYEALTYAGD